MTTTQKVEWRCEKCRKLLGILQGLRVQIDSARGHCYLASLPVTSTCKGCHALNEITSERSDSSVRG